MPAPRSLLLTLRFPAFALRRDWGSRVWRAAAPSSRCSLHLHHHHNETRRRGPRCCLSLDLLLLCCRVLVGWVGGRAGQPGGGAGRGWQGRDSFRTCWEGWGTAGGSVWAPKWPRAAHRPHAFLSAKVSMLAGPWRAMARPRANSQCRILFLYVSGSGL